MESLLKYYIKKLETIKDIEFLDKYLRTETLLRLKKIGYFCGMHYASKNVYNFSEYISRYDHSYTTALLTWKLTHNKVQTISALFHDVGTPCFSHVIDYMNKDYNNQESTELYTYNIMKSDISLQLLLKEDEYYLEDICDFKKYSIVDSERPKLCSDRLDGIILSSIGWTKNINKELIDKILNGLIVVLNEDCQYEISFKTKSIALEVLKMSNEIDELCHSNEDCYMMDLLSKITMEAININLITYDNLYIFTELELLNIFNNSNNIKIQSMLKLFYNIKKEDIDKIELLPIKKRILQPLVFNKRIDDKNYL